MFKTMLSRNTVAIIMVLLVIVSIVSFIQSYNWIPSTVNSILRLYPSLKNKDINHIILFLEKERTKFSSQLKKLMNMLRNNPQNTQLLDEINDARNILIEINRTIDGLKLVVNDPFTAFMYYFEGKYLMITPISFFILIFSMIITAWYGQLYSSGILHIVVSRTKRRRFALKLIKKVLLIIAVISGTIMFALILGLKLNPVIGCSIVLSSNMAVNVLIYFVSIGVSPLILILFGISLVTIFSGSVIEALTFILVYDLVLPVLIPFFGSPVMYFFIAGLRPLDTVVFTKYLLVLPPSYVRELSSVFSCDPVLLMDTVLALIFLLSILLYITSIEYKDLA